MPSNVLTTVGDSMIQHIQTLDSTKFKYPKLAINQVHFHLTYER